jgi:hypothetical protein
LDATSEEIAKTFAQLKRDADDLCQAIAAVEAAINADGRGMPPGSLSRTARQPPHFSHEDAC